jgi:hypothetical protein
MTAWRNLLSERTELYSPIGLLPTDSLTGLRPLGRVSASLDVSDSGGEWRSTGIRASVTVGGVIAYPGLERRAEVVGQPPRRYRVRLEADFYRPLYRASSDGIEFDAYPSGDANPPQVIVSQAQTVFLAPSTNYPFPTHVSVLRGNVVDLAGSAVVDTLVTAETREQVLTDERGTFELPLRWLQKDVPTSVKAEDQRTGRTGIIIVVIPADLGKNHTIAIS